MIRFARTRWVRWASAAVALTTVLFQGGEARPAHGLVARIGPPEVMSERFTGVVVTLFLDKRVVESWLPEGLSLAESPYTDHPVIVLYGTQRGLARHKRITIYPRFGRSFHETFVAIPYLRLQGCAGKEPVFHFVRLYVDSPRATSQGIRRFGWPKICTAIDVHEQTYRILGGPTGSLFEGRADYDRAEPVPPQSASLGELREMFSQPLVLEHRGCFDRYDFDLHFDSATIRSVPAEVRIREGFMPGVAPRVVNTPGISRQAFGAFFIDCRITKTPRD